jgi:hypothetical protein
VCPLSNCPCFFPRNECKNVLSDMNLFPGFV